MNEQNVELGEITLKSVTPSTITIAPANNERGIRVTEADVQALREGKEITVEARPEDAAEAVN